MTGDDLTEQGLQLQHQTEMLTRRLPIARKALETIEKGEWAPEVLKTAREALSTLETIDGLDALKILYRKTSAGNQQLQYEHSLAERKMAIARTALETIANGETDPGVRKLARETLDGFSALSDGEKFMGFFVGVQQDRPIPEVGPTDLRHFHEDMIEGSRDAGSRRCDWPRSPGAKNFSDRRGSSLRPQLVARHHVDAGPSG